MRPTAIVYNPSLAYCEIGYWSKDTSIIQLIVLIFSVVFLNISPFFVISYLHFAIIRFLKSHNKQHHIANQNQCQASNDSQKSSKRCPETDPPKRQRNRKTSSLEANRQNESDDHIFIVNKENVETQINRDIPRTSKCKKVETGIQTDTGGVSNAGFDGVADDEIEIILEDTINSVGRNTCLFSEETDASDFATIESFKPDLVKYVKNKPPQKESIVWFGYLQLIGPQSLGSIVVVSLCVLLLIWV